jgi:hypothetical protein
MPGDEPHRNRAVTSGEWHSKTDVTDLIHFNCSHRKGQDYCAQQETGKGRSNPTLCLQTGKCVATNISTVPCKPWYKSFPAIGFLN